MYNFELNILKKYSKISLKKKRNRKKFNKYPHRYVKHHIFCLHRAFNSIFSLNRSLMNLDLIPVECIEIPKGVLFFLDKKYGKENNSIC